MSQELYPQTNDMQEQAPQDTRTEQERANDEAVRVCLGCIVAREEFIIGGVMKVNDIADCRGLNNVTASASLKRLADGNYGTPLITYSTNTKRPTFRLAYEAMDLFTENRPEDCTNVVPRRTVSQPSLKPRKPSEPITTRTARLPGPEDYSHCVPTPEAIKEAPLPQWISDIIAAEDAPQPVVKSLSVTVQECLNRSILRLGSLQEQGRSTTSAPQHFDHETQQYLAFGPALTGKSEATRRAIMHAWGIDWLVYGRRLDPAALKHAVGISQTASLGVYAQQVLAQIERKSEIKQV